jgi:hypothetical protein
MAKLLGRSPNFLANRSFKSDLYCVWDEKKPSGGVRTIEAPRADLKAIQRRITDLLQRVLPPDYLFCPVKGRSYVENALVHRGNQEVRLLDVVNYFGNCNWKAVYRFFRDDLRCDPDIAWLLTGLTTREGHLPQGSPCSPILSFYSCSPMWAEIAGLVHGAGCTLTVYVDDITLSGRFIPEALVWEIKKVLHRFGHSHHRGKERRHFGRAAEITGIIVAPDKVCVPHRHYKKLQAARLGIRTARNDEEAASLSSRARSLEAQIQSLRRRT